MKKKGKRDKKNKEVTDEMTGGRLRNNCAETDNELDRITRINNFQIQTN